jgi:peroxiredoxin
LQQVAGTLKELNATIVAITPQLAEASRSLIEKQKISFDLLYPTRAMPTLRSSVSGSDCPMI